MQVHKRVGVRVGQGDAGGSDGWDGHTLESLMALQPKEQALLMLHLDTLTKGKRESVKDHIIRVKLRYSRDTLEPFLSAEKHWRSQVGLVTTGLKKAGTVYDRFVRFKNAFDWRMMYNEVSEKVAAAKVDAGNPAEPSDDGLISNGSTSSMVKLKHLNAGKALEGCISSKLNMYDILRSLQRLKTVHALSSALSEDPKSKYMALLFKCLSVPVTADDSDD